MRYDPASEGAPRVVAKGRELVAQRIREIGAAHGVPVLEAPPLARAVTRIHPALYRWFNALPLLRTHVLAWVEKPGSLGAAR